MTENLADTVDLWRRTRPLHNCYGFRDTTDGECNGTGTQRNRRSSNQRRMQCNMKSGETIPLKRSTACLLVGEHKQLDSGLGETRKTHRRNHTIQTFCVIQCICGLQDGMDFSAPTGLRVFSKDTVLLESDSCSVRRIIFFISKRLGKSLFVTFGSSFFLIADLNSVWAWV